MGTKNTLGMALLQQNPLCGWSWAVLCFWLGEESQTDGGNGGVGTFLRWPIVSVVFNWSFLPVLPGLPGVNWTPVWSWWEVAGGSTWVPSVTSWESRPVQFFCWVGSCKKTCVFFFFFPILGSLTNMPSFIHLSELVFCCQLPRVHG